jgi:MYXO-CTERM domain-containing protein
MRLAPVLVLALAVVPVVAQASAPVGVWSLVDQVTLEPSDDKPTLIRIDGTFIVANEQPDFPAYPGYSEPQSGFMFYSCSEADLVTCAAEWIELQAVAGGEDNCRGWGSNQLPDNGKVRPAADPQESPDLWPIAMGIQMGFAPCDALRMWDGGESDTAGETGDPMTDSLSDSASVSESASDTNPESATATASDTASGDPGTGTAGETGIGETAGDEAGTTAASAGEASAGDTTAAETTPPADDGDKAGCACIAAAAPTGPGALALLVLLGLVRRRR